MPNDQETLAELYYYSVISGMFASSGSVFGKLSGFFTWEDTGNLVMKAVFITLMLVCNTAVWTYFVKALQASNTTIIPTLASTASNYICTALSSWILFGEKVTLLWWFGASLVLTGFALVTRSGIGQNDLSYEKSDQKKRHSD